MLNGEKRIAAIVVTYNRKQLLCECLEALLNQTYRDFDIYVIDNASTDGTETMVRDRFSNQPINYLNTGNNLGGAGGFQYGIKCAVEAGYTYVWIMDDDSIPRQDALEKLVKQGKLYNQFGFLASKVLWIDGTCCKMNIPKNEKMQGFIRSTEKASCVGAATFVSIFIPTSVILDVGLPIKEFFIWTDDLEFTRRISRKYSCFYVPESEVYHKCATNNGANIATDVEDRIDRYWYAYRNEVYLYKREGIAGLIHLGLRTPIHLLRVLMKAKTSKKKRMNIILKGTLTGMHFAPQVEYCKNNYEKNN